MKLRLFHYWRSSCSWRVRFVLAHKKIQAEYIPVNLLNDESESTAYRARNPLGYVPALEILEKDKSSKWLTESIAICEWLDEVFPENPIFPTEPYLKAKTRQLVETINAGTQPLQNLNVLEKISDDLQVKKNWSQHWIHLGLQAYETLCLDSAGKYSIGNTPTLADFCLIPQCYNAIRNEMNLGKYPTVVKIRENVLKLEIHETSKPEAFEPRSSS